MPYQILVFRGDPDLPDAIGPAEALNALRGVREADRDITAPAWRVWSSSSPWFVASLDAGVLTLSASCANPGFLPLLERFGLEAARVAGVLRGRAVEEVRGEVITAVNAAGAYAREGRLHQQLTRTVEEVWQGIERGGRAPLDFPVGPRDVVEEYLAFDLAGARDPAAVRAALVAMLGRHRVREEGGTLSLLAPHEPPGLLHRLLEAAPAAPTLVRVTPHAHGVGIRPAWSAGIGVFGPVLLDVTAHLARTLGGAVTLDGVPFDPRVEAELRIRMAGTLVDLWRWTQRMGTRS